MELNEYTHTLIAVVCLYGTYFLGSVLNSKKSIDNIVTMTLEKLKNEGLILTKEDKNGEVDIIPISEIIAKATKDAITK
jgi:hypothetical protein|tara:strand:- start:178 stop:414 length:237 start_codon:yes stop_codon:yes gene_type:complete